MFFNLYHPLATPIKLDHSTETPEKKDEQVDISENFEKIESDSKTSQALSKIESPTKL